MTVATARVTRRGVLVPRSLIETWGDVREVEIEQQAGAVVIRPKALRADESYAEMIDKMKAAGLIEEMPWPQPAPVSVQERARLAEKLSHGKPLSEIVIEDREDRV